MSNLVVADGAPSAPVSVPSQSVLADPRRTEMNMKAAEFFAKSDLVPTHYRGKPANCFIAINRAQRLGVDEMYFMEKTYVIGGKLGMSAELAIELANASGRFKGPIRFKLTGEGKTRACTAYATIAETGETVENVVSYDMAQRDGWTKNSKWQTLTDQMLQYRAGVFLARLYAGGSMGGMYTREELEDVRASQAVDVTPPREQPKPLPQLHNPEHQRALEAQAPIEAEVVEPAPPKKAEPKSFWDRDKYDLKAKTMDEFVKRLTNAVLAAPSAEAIAKIQDDNRAMVDGLKLDASWPQMEAFINERLDYLNNPPADEEVL